jgi:hypothetical protein
MKAGMIACEEAEKPRGRNADSFRFYTFVTLDENVDDVERYVERYLLDTYLLHPILTNQNYDSFFLLLL